MTLNIDERLERARRPAIWLRPSNEVSSSRSKIGGLPELPPFVPWPRHGLTKKPLHFLAQIDLAHLPATPLSADGPELPRRGSLFFFADIYVELAWDAEDLEWGSGYDQVRVIYAEVFGSPTTPPEDIPELGHDWGKVDGGYAEGQCVAPEFRLESHVIDSFIGLDAYHWDDDFNDAGLACVVASMERAVGPGQSGSGWQQLLGAPGGSADANLQKSGYVHLLKICPDHTAEFLRNSVAYFWIKRSDFDAGRFDRAFAFART